MEGTVKLEYGLCVDIVTKAAFHENGNAMFSCHTCASAGRLLPLGPKALAKLLIGLMVRVMVTLLKANGGGIRDNAKN